MIEDQRRKLVDHIDTLSCDARCLRFLRLGVPDQKVGQVGFSQRAAENVKRISDHRRRGIRSVSGVGGDIINLVDQTGKIDSCCEQASPEARISGAIFRCRSGIRGIGMGLEILR